ncbi:MAG TPA: hypothetical protein VK466_11120 [Terriglobales bacterium]|nr:hypothetical protein [Terriglobales bacterium]
MAQPAVIPPTGNSAQDPLVISYLGLRKAVGIIGVALPLVLAIGKALLQGPGIEPSISDYYYTHLGNVFVGSLWAIGVFLLSTRGYDWRDQTAGISACIFAVGVALFPTTPNCQPITAIGRAHFTFAALFFLTLAYFSYFLFTETATDRRPTPRKLQRNVVYRVCGIAIVGCILLIAILKFSGKETLLGLPNPVFWLESIAVWSFGVSWLTKGETILKDN